MISDKMQDALNGQINAELYSAYLYLSAAAYFEDTNLTGCANWMRLQAQEEVSHAMKIFSHVAERGGRVLLAAIAEPPGEWDSPLAVFQAAYAHEQKVTGMINDLGDHAAGVFLQWFVSEQVEEEAAADAIVHKLELVGDSANGLFLVDREMGQRQAG